MFFRGSVLSRRELGAKRRLIMDCLPFLQAGRFLIKKMVLFFSDYCGCASACEFLSLLFFSFLFIFYF